MAGIVLVRYQSMREYLLRNRAMDSPREEKKAVKLTKGLGVLLLVTAGSLALLATPAEAARGNVQFTDSATGLSTFIADPIYGCHSTAAFDIVRNSTDAPVFVYQDALCKVGSVVVHPDGTPVDVGVRRSVFVTQ